MTHTECLICGMSNTFQVSQGNTDSFVEPKEILSKLNLIFNRDAHGTQEDAHEFLLFLKKHFVETNSDRSSFVDRSRNIAVRSVFVSLLSWLRSETVSYTHLDVYKRQL